MSALQLILTVIPGSVTKVAFIFFSPLKKKHRHIFALASLCDIVMSTGRITYSAFSGNKNVALEPFSRRYSPKELKRKLKSCL